LEANMQDRPINSFNVIYAMSAAHHSPEAFAAEFSKPEADANCLLSNRARGFSDEDGESSYISEYLIHILIHAIPDEKLPPLLAILIEHDVDLERRDHGSQKYKPLAFAVVFGKKATVAFLASKGVEINDTVMPALCATGNMPDVGIPISTCLEIIEILIEQYQAKIDIQDENHTTALMYAAQDSELDTVRYLLTKKASLFIRKENGATALSLSYQEYYLLADVADKTGESTYLPQSEACLGLLIKAAYEYFYLKALDFKESKEELKKILTQDLIAMVGDHLGSARNDVLIGMLLNDALNPALKHIKEREEREVRLAVCMGALKENTKNTMHKTVFANELFDSKALLEIFSFMGHSRLPKMNDANTPAEYPSRDNTTQMKLS
jgi:hypothetical protein